MIRILLGVIVLLLLVLFVREIKREMKKYKKLRELGDSKGELDVLKIEKEISRTALQIAKKREEVAGKEK